MLAIVFMPIAPAWSVLALIGGGFLAFDQARAARRFSAGAQAEDLVAAELDPLNDLGLVVQHDVSKGRYGNVDHIVYAIDQVVIVETKANTAISAHADQARRHVAWLQPAVDLPVYCVICLANRDQRPFRMDGVWVCGLPQLRDLIATIQSR